MAIAEVILLTGITALAFWRRETLIYFVAFFCCLFIGASWFDASMPLGISAMLLGGIMLLKAIIQIVQGGARLGNGNQTK
jgi:hypothetical protein